MTRKTIDVDQVRDWTNTRLAAPGSFHTGLADLSPEQAFRLGVASLLEQILHGTGNYAGFGYTETYVAGQTDETRRRYYAK
jgi:hypothetical protein